MRSVTGKAVKHLVSDLMCLNSYFPVSVTLSVMQLGLKCHRTQGNAALPPLVYGGKSNPTSDFPKGERER